jgi:hypothetical protein
MGSGALSIFIFWVLVTQVQQAPRSTNAPSEGVDVRYARAQVQLAEANLKRVEQSNQQFERTVPKSVVAEYQHDLLVAKSRLVRVSSGKAGGEFQVWLQRGEAERAAAETAWETAKAANSSVKGTFGPIDMERFRLRAEVAKLQMERGQELVNGAREAQLQWEIDMLDNRVQRLTEESRQATPEGGLYLPWAW